jgi:uncharacterized Fe-S cluster-containing radical SAM superfamily enzyme
VEEKRLKQQEVEAKIITQEKQIIDHSKWLLNAKVELNRIVEYNEKVAKGRKWSIYGFEQSIWYRSSSKQIKKSVCKL